MDRHSCPVRTSNRGQGRLTAERGGRTVNQWIDYKAVAEIVVIGLLAGAGLPALFAIGMRALAWPGKGHVTVKENELVGRNPAGIAVAAGCFAIVLAAVGYGIYIIVVTGHK
jgi:hypothetical protein